MVMKFTAATQERTMLLNPCPTAISAFTWVKEENVLVVEASDLHAARGGYGRVWDDAYDVGITLVSPTGRRVVYALASQERRDGELLWDDLRPALSADSALPTVRIFND